MELDHFIATVVIGVVAGVAARIFVKVGTMGYIGDIIVGVSSALIVAFMLPTIGFSFGGGIEVTIILATIGAISGLFFLRKAKTA